MACSLAQQMHFYYPFYYFPQSSMFNILVQPCLVMKLTHVPIVKHSIETTNVFFPHSDYICTQGKLKIISCLVGPISLSLLKLLSIW